MVASPTLPTWTKEVSGRDETRRFTIGTLVTDYITYGQMHDSFVQSGFGTEDCEYLCIDNTRTPQTGAYAGLNKLLEAASGKYVILCHQDILIEHDDRATLEALLSNLEEADPDWAVAGNAGVTSDLERAIYIEDPTAVGMQRCLPPANRENICPGFPIPVVSLDENFLLLRRKSGVRFSNDIKFADVRQSFHLYGTDICLNAEILGYSAYVIEFLVHHLSPGNHAGLSEATRAFQSKWGCVFPKRVLRTTCTQFEL